MTLPSDVLGRLYPAQGVEPEWLMHDSERMALLHILRISQPVVSLEIGTASGGSLRHIREHSRKTYSIDIDPKVREKLEPRMPDVRFLTGLRRTHS
jgi:predicted O-methyltransferase YrrM